MVEFPSIRRRDAHPPEPVPEIEQELEPGDLLVMHLNAVEARAFIQLMRTYSLEDIIAQARVLAPTVEGAQHIVLLKLEQFADQIRRQRALETLPTTTFRYVSEKDPSSMSLGNIIDSANQYGGKRPNQESDIICVDSGHKIVKYLEEYLPRQRNILFVYDATRLIVPTAEERERDVNIKYYGKKPRSGQTLRDTLLGAIAFTDVEESRDPRFRARFDSAIYQRCDQTKGGPIPVRLRPGERVVTRMTQGRIGYAVIDQATSTETRFIQITSNDFNDNTIQLFAFLQQNISVLLNIME